MESSVDVGRSLGSVVALIRQDVAANPRDFKAQFVLSFFRLAHWARMGRPLKLLLALPIAAAYRIVVECIMGIELRPKTQLGPSARLYHGHGLVVNDRSLIGRNVVLRHGVTIGSATDGGPCPVIGDSVEIGAGAIIIGGITIGDRARIGAGAIVARDVPAGAVARGPRAVIYETSDSVAVSLSVSDTPPSCHRDL